jgi:hypothetical protein
MFKIGDKVNIIDSKLNINHALTKGVVAITYTDVFDTTVFHLIRYDAPYTETGHDYIKLSEDMLNLSE